MSRMCVAVGGCVYHCVQKGVRTGRIIEAQYILAEQERTPKALGLRAGHPFRCLGPGVVPATTGPAGEGPCADYLFYPAALGHVLCNTQSYERGAWSSVRSQASLAQHLVLQHGQPLARPTGVRHQSLGHTSCLLDLCVLTAVFLRISFDCHPKLLVPTQDAYAEQTGCPRERPVYVRTWKGVPSCIGQGHVRPPNAHTTHYPSPLPVRTTFILVV